MATTTALNRRIEKLENAGNGEDEHILILVDVDGDERKNKDCSSYIMDCIEESCNDEELRQRLLEQAFLDVEDRNPFAAPEKIKIIPIYANVAGRLVELLRKEGIEVRL